MQTKSKRHTYKVEVFSILNLKAKGKKRKPELKQMDNFSKKRIGEEIEKYHNEKEEGSGSEDILPVNTSPTNPKEKINSKAPQTE